MIGQDGLIINKNETLCFVFSKLQTKINGCYTQAALKVFLLAFLLCLSEQTNLVEQQKMRPRVSIQSLFYLCCFCSLSLFPQRLTVQRSQSWPWTRPRCRLQGWMERWIVGRVPGSVCLGGSVCSFNPVVSLLLVAEGNDGQLCVYSLEDDGENSTFRVTVLKMLKQP